MANDGYYGLGGEELSNHSRLVQLADAMGINAVRLTKDKTDWVQQTRGGVGYGNVANAPWYDPGYPASAEFAGIMVQEVRGIDDSTLESSVTEYVGAGGSNGKQRNATLTMVWSVVIVASTERGADFGKRWLDRRLAGTIQPGSCGGRELDYYRFANSAAVKVHRRNVATSRSTSVLRKRTSKCQTLWWATFTLTAGDPFEYGEEISRVTAIGQATNATGPAVTSSGGQVIVQESCPVFDYSPIFDPLYPAMIAPPVVPNYYPDGWGITPGMSFQRRWARLSALEPSALLSVPVIKLTSTTEARMVRVSLWDSLSPTNDQCGWLWSAVITYLPANLPIYIDGEQEAAYAWDGASPNVRRSDSLLYDPDAKPMDWTAFPDFGNMLMTLDTMAIPPAQGGGYQGGGNVRATLSLVAKSD